jgi:signal transduction histidine kinase
MAGSGLMTKHFFRVSGKITQLLGREALSNDLEAISEILRNSNDADAKSATISFDFRKSPEIRIVEEEGDGMTYEQIVNNFLVIGTYDKTPRKTDEPRITKRHGRVMIGRKGVGRFALEKLGRHCEIISKPINSRKKLSFEIDWDKFEGRKVTVDQVDIPIYEEDRGREEGSGLEIIIKDLRDYEWNQEKIDEIAQNLKQLVLPKELQPKNAFNIFYEAPYFGTPKTPLIPELSEKAFFELHAKLRKTKIVLKAKKVGGHYFEKEYDEITFHENPKETKKVSDLVCGTTELTVFYFPQFNKTDSLKSEYYEKAVKYYGESFWQNIPNVMSSFHGVRIHQDGVRQFKYGDDDYDIAKREIIARRMAGTMQADRLVGFCLISGKENPDIIPTINRMEAIDNQAFRDLREFILFSMRRLDNRINKERDAKFAAHKLKTKSSLTSLGKATKILKAPGPISQTKRAELQETVKVAKDIIQGKNQQNETETNITLQESVEQALGEWTDRVYHDFVVPVTSDNDNAVKEIFKIKEKLNEQEQENVEILQDTKEIMNYFFDAIEDFTTKLESETFWSSPKKSNINLKKFTQKVFDRTRKMFEIEEDQIKLDLAFSEHLEFTIFKPVFFSLFYNLFSNSIKAILNNEKQNPDEYRIRVHVHGLEKNNFSIFVSDDSTKSLQPKDNEILFDKRISRTATTGHGRGLGLYNLRRMLNFFDGEIEIVQPHFGKGTTLKVTLPSSNITKG